MFTYRHFIWLFICLLIVIFSLRYFKRNNYTINQVLNIACVICILSELVKIFSMIQMVPSTSGTVFYPYLSNNHMPLHLCSIQILFIFYVRFTNNQKNREMLLSFMYPSCLIGAIMALAMPSIFTTSIPVEKAFVSPMAYQFFIFHTMLVVLGIYIVMSKEIKREMKHLYFSLGFLFFLGFISIYINSLLGAPTYIDGKLVSVDFVTNFFFIYDDPIGLTLTKIEHWYIYFVVIVLLSIILITAFMYPLIRKERKQLQ